MATCCTAESARAAALVVEIAAIASPPPLLGPQLPFTEGMLVVMHALEKLAWLCSVYGQFHFDTGEGKRGEGEKGGRGVMD